MALTVCRRILSLAVLCLLMGNLVMPQAAKAAPDAFCGSYLAEETNKLEEFHRLSNWLSENKDNINPQLTHLREFENFARELIIDIKVHIFANKEKPFHARQSKYLRKLFLEIESRIASKNLTYEYLYILAFRLGLFTNMDIEDPLKASLTRFEKEFIFQPESYLTHDSTMRFLRMATARNENERIPTSSWNIVMSGLQSFPEIAFVPTMADLTYRDINLATARFAQPLGISFESLKVDGMTLNQFSFTQHDLLHALVRRGDERVFSALRYPAVWLDRLEAPVLGLIEATKLTHPKHFYVLQFIHFHVFHENPGYNWHYEDENGVKQKLESKDDVIKSINFQFEVLKEFKEDHVREEFLEVTSGINNPDAFLEEAISIYRKYFYQALNNL